MHDSRMVHHFSWLGHLGELTKEANMRISFEYKVRGFGKNNIRGKESCLQIGGQQIHMSMAPEALPPQGIMAHLCAISPVQPRNFSKSLPWIQHWNPTATPCSYDDGFIQFWELPNTKIHVEEVIEMDNMTSQARARIDLVKGAVR